MSQKMHFDAFISYSSEDRDAIIIPFLEASKKHNINTWCDIHEITWGDSIVEKIQDGMRDATFIIVFITQSYLNKSWPLKELKASLAKQLSGGPQVLPVLLGVSIDEVNYHFPFLSDIKHLSLASYDPTISSPIWFVDQIIDALEQKGKKQSVLTSNTETGDNVDESTKNNLTEINQDTPDLPGHPFPDLKQLGFSDLRPIDPKVLDKELGTMYIEEELPNIISQLSEDMRLNHGIAMLDIDDLTVINKHFGRKVGDLVLSVVANLIQRRKNVGKFGRCGDDTFYVLIYTDPRKVTLECQKMLRNIKHFRWNTISPELHVTASIGYAILDPQESPASWIIRSLEGLREGKKLGKDIVNIGPEVLGKRYPRGMDAFLDDLEGSTKARKARHLKLRDYVS